MHQQYENCQIIITVNNNYYYKIAYSYNNNTTFQDLIEYFSSLFPSLEICPCYDFSIESNHKKNKIKKNSLIKNNVKSFNKLFLNKSNINCTHLYNNYLKSSKESIYLFFQNEKKQNELIAKNNFEKVNQEKMELMGEYNDKKADLAKKINEIRDIKNENDELIKALEMKNKKIKDLENQIRSDLIGKDNTIANLKKELNSKIETIANLDNQINELKKNLKLKINKIYELENKINIQEQDLGNKNNLINDLKKNENILKDELEKLNKENALLAAGINGDLDKIVKLKELGLKGDNLKEKENLVKINPENNEIVGNQKFEKPKFADFYDVIVHIDSIKDINKGWQIEMNQNCEQNYQKYKNEKVIKIGVIGNANKGKSFILSKISKMKFPSGFSIKTEGLSIKYPDTTLFYDRRIALLDSAGLETPVLISDENQNNINKNDLFKEKSREKLITELFLQNYIMYYSDILIIVVDSLSFSEQKLLMKIKKEMERAKINTPLYIIHNLKSFTSKEQVKDYIDSSLLKSATFTLEEGHKISTKKEEVIKGIYFYEKDKDKEKEKNKERKIYHLIYANENSEAGKFYNQFTLDFIENSYQTVTDLESFDVIDTIKERYMAISKDIIEKTGNEEKITKESFDNSTPNMIKLNSDKEIILKKCLIDELGFSNFKANGFEPTYNIYKKEDKIIVRVEVPGKTAIKAGLEISGEYNIIKIMGEKKLDQEPGKLDDNIHNTREYGNFYLDLHLKTEEYLLSQEEPEIKVKKGVYIFEFNLAKKAGMKEYNNNDNNDEDP